MWDWLASVAGVVLGYQFIVHHTHVANTYKDPIYVHVDADRSYLDRLDLEIDAYLKDIRTNVQVGGKLKSVTQIRWEFAEKNGFTKIYPRQYSKFTPDNPEQRSVYVSAFSEDGGVYAHTHPVRSDYSVIISSRGSFKIAAYGYPVSRFKDESGTFHRRK